MKHDLPPNSWRCVRRGERASECIVSPTCAPDDGATFVASLSEARDSGGYDPYFAVTCAETYTPLPADVEE